MKNNIILIVGIIVIIGAVALFSNNSINSPKKATNTKAQIEQINKQIAKSKNPNPQVYLTRGRLKLNAKDYQGALEDFAKAKNNKMKDTRAYLYSAMAQERLNNYQAAIQELDEALQVNPNDIRIKSEIKRLERKMK